LFDVVFTSTSRRATTRKTMKPNTEEQYTSGRDFLARLLQMVQEGNADRFLRHVLSFDFDGPSPVGAPSIRASVRARPDRPLSPPERFVAEWYGGTTRLPVQLCSCEQLYRAFCRWCEMSGEKRPAARSQFTLQVKRRFAEISSSTGKEGSDLPSLVYKGCSLRLSNGRRRTVRCWIPECAEPLEGMSEGAWAAVSIDAFEKPLNRFLAASKTTTIKTRAPADESERHG
jgi:putative DNA primase/helicase